MSSTPILERTQIDWFDSVKLQLDALRSDCQLVEDKSSVPSDAVFEQAKFEIEKLHRLAEFPPLPEAHIWVGPDGQLGFTWSFGENKFELMFGSKILVRVYDNEEQARVALSNAPKVLKALANPPRNAA
jgi:hypothetical protein